MARLLKNKISHKSADCTEQNLPHNRWQVFCDVLKRRWRFLMVVSLLTSIFCLPYFVWNWIVGQTIRRLSQAETVNAIELLSYVNTRGAVNIALFALCGVGLSGGVYVVQRLVWGEVVFVGDFWQGLKGTWYKNAFALGIVGLAAWCVDFVFVYAPTQIGDVAVRMLFYGVSILFVCFAAVFALFVAVQNAVYNVGWGHCFKNAAMLTLKSFFPTLGLLVVAVIPQTICFFFDNTIVDIVGYVLVAVFLSGVFMLVAVLVADHTLDKEINAKTYPQIVDKGIVRN